MKSFEEWGKDGICSCGESRDMWKDWQEERIGMLKRIEELKADKADLVSVLTLKNMEGRK